MLPDYIATHPNSILTSWYKPDWAVGYVLLAGIVQNVFVLLLLKKEIGALRFSFDFDFTLSLMVFIILLYYNFQTFTKRSMPNYSFTKSQSKACNINS